MKRLKDHVILYDAECPMCNLYTKGFLQAGMLDKDGRLPYQEMPASLSCKLDHTRFTDEIALVDKSSGRVYYGTESLFLVIGHSVPFLQPLFRNSMFRKIVGIAYKFISFNRRIIIPANNSEIENERFQPGFNRPYRLAYLIFAWLMTSFILHQYSFYLTDIMAHGSLLREGLICGGQLLWQLAVLKLLGRRGAWDYLGNIATISLAGALLLGLVMFIGTMLNVSSTSFYAGGFFVVVSLMFLEHIRRTKLLRQPWVLSASWVLYRVLVLLILILFSYVH